MCECSTRYEENFASSFELHADNWAKGHWVPFLFILVQNEKKMRKGKTWKTCITHTDNNKTSGQRIALPIFTDSQKDEG